jgi:hypothetical protein
MNIIKFTTIFWKYGKIKEFIRELREFSRIKPEYFSYSRKFAQFADKFFG